MIITEIVAVDPAALCQTSTVTGYESENDDGFKRAADAVEGEGACLIAQLWHPGRQQLWSPVASPKGISDQPDAYSWTVPHVMTTAELRQVAHGLRPSCLDDGLHPALSILAESVPIPMDLDFTADGVLPDDIATTAYYVVSDQQPLAESIEPLNFPATAGGRQSFFEQRLHLLLGLIVEGQDQRVL
jgi:hypothetical protein